MKRTTKKTAKTTKTIGRQGVYIGTTHPWARGLRVEIGALRETDLIAFAPEIVEKDGTRRFSWATSDAVLADLRLDE